MFISTSDQSSSESNTILFYFTYFTQFIAKFWRDPFAFRFRAPLVTQKRHEIATVLFSFQFVTLEQALEEGFDEKNAFSF